MRRRGQGFFDNFRNILGYAERTRPDLVVHGGDLFFRRRIPPKIVDMVYEALLEFSEAGIPMFIVPGNHEGSRLPASLWLEAASLHVFDRPRTFHVEVSGQVVAISGFPFVRADAGVKFAEMVAETGWQDTAAPIRILCMHQAVDGAQFGPANYTFRAGRDVVSLPDIPEDFSVVLTGHIHRRQVLTASRGKGAPPIIYAGSIERTSFSEKDEPKGFFEICLGMDENGRWTANDITFRELPTRPMVEVSIGPEIDASGLRAYLEQSISGADQDSIVKLRSRWAPDPSVRARLTAPFLRSVFPPSMNVQLGAEFYRDARPVEHARQ